MFFQKNLQDLIKFAKCAGDPQAFLTSSLNEIKIELKSQDIKAKSAALLKLYFLKMEDYDIRWANFDILQMMSSSQFIPKQLAYTTASLTFEPNSDCIMMTTNLFKKELKNPIYIECSVMLSCLTNICTREIALETCDLVMGLHNHTKHIIRKKSAALLGKMFLVAPELIPNNLEKILGRIGTVEENSSVLTGYLQIMNSVFAVNPKLYPLFIKPLYDLLEKQKNNWLIIKIIKLLDKILLLEPRLIKKLVDPYQKLLKSTSAKSIEFELLNTIIRHFKEHSSLYNQACDNLKSFINHIDANLRSLGLSCLKTMLNNNKKVLPEYKDYLLESLKKADLPTKKQILEIFHCFVEKDLLEDIVSELLQYLEETPNNRNLDENLKEALIETIMKLCKKDNFIHIEDFEWLLFEVFGKLMRKVTNVILAKELSSNLLTLILRVQDLKSCVQKFCVNTLMGFDEIAIEKQTFSELKISIQGRLKRPEISAKEIVFQTLVFLAGEYAYNCRMPSEFFGLLEYFDNEKLLYLYGNSYHLVKEACFKIAVGLCGLLVDSSMEKLKGNLEKIELKSESLRFLGDLNEAPNQNILIWTMVRVLGYLLSLNQKLLKLNHSNIYDNGSSNLMMGFLFSAIGLDYKGLITEEIRLGDQGILEKITLESLKKIADLRKLFKNELKPVHPEAQKFVKIPEGLLLDIGLEIDPIEVEMMISMKREFDIEENTLNKNKDEKKGKRNKKNKEKEIIEIKNEENTQKGEIIENNNNKEKNEEEGKKNENEEVKEKKEYILNVEDYLPPGVDVTMLKKNEEGEKPIKKKKNKIKEIK